MSTELRPWFRRRWALARPYSSTARLEPHVHAYVGAVLAAAVALAAALLLLSDRRLERPWLIVAIAGLVALENVRSVRLHRGTQGESIAYEDALLVFAALLLPPVPALAAFVVGIAAGQLAPAGGGVKRAFNLGQFTAAAAVALLVVDALGSPGESPQRRVLAVLLGALAFAVVNRLAVWGVIALTEGKPFRASVRAGFRAQAALWAGTVSVGLLAGLVGLTHAWSLPLALAAIVALNISYSGQVRAVQLRRGYTDVIRSASAAFVSVDAAGFVQAWNPELERVTGVTAREARGAPLTASLRLRGADDSPPPDLLSPAALSEPGDRETVRVEPRGAPARWLSFSRASLPEGGFAFVGRDVTRQREAELASRRSEERLRLALEGARLGHWDWERDSGVVRWSESLEQICGLAPGSFGGSYDDFIALVHPDDRDAVELAVDAGLEDGYQDCTYRIVRPDGGVRWLEDLGRVVTDAGGRPSGMSGVAFDVTARMRAEARATLQRRVLEEIATGTPLAETLDLLMRLIEEQAGSLLASVLALDDENRLRHLAGASLPGRFVEAIDGTPIGPEVGSCGTAAYLREPVVASDISTDPRWADFRDLALAHGLRACWSVPLVGSDDSVLGTFAMYYREPRPPSPEDLELGELATDLARVAIERAQQERRLVGAEKKYRRLVDHLPLAVYAFAPADGAAELCGAAQYVGPQVEAMLGYSPEEWRAEPELYTTIVHPEDRARVQGEVQQARIVGDTFRSEYRMVAKDGRVVWVHDESVYVRDEEGSVVGIEGFLLDVSDRKALESGLVQAQKLEAVGRLAGGVAHDFNNLMSAVLGFGDLALQRLQSEDPVRAYVDQIVRAGERAAGLTGQLLAFSRTQVLQPRALDLNAVVTESEQLLRRLIGEDVVLTSVLDPELDPVLADPAQLEQVIVNLAVNARDAMPTGGKLTIETANVELEREYAASHFDVEPGHYVLLAVTDTGGGMDEETQSHIFEPFFTTKAEGEGTGLGLATVFGIVKQTGGDISVYSEPGRGTTFRLYLPRAQRAAEPAEPGRDGPGLARGSETVLLVEDDDLVRDLERQVLETCGYTVLEARGPRHALDLAADHEGGIDLVLTDVVMPELSGRELVEQLASSRPEARVLYASGYTDDAVVRHGVLEADVAFLTKPFTLSALAAKVREVLDANGGTQHE